MLIIKILQRFLLPSVFLPLLILLGLIFLLRFKKKKIKKIGKALIITGIVFYYFFSITPAADLILQPLENQYQTIGEEELNEADKIVFLLGNWENSILRASEVLRIYFVKSQISESNPKIIISGVNPLKPEKQEPEDIREYLSERGILPEDITVENKSRNTAESAKNIKEIVGNESFFLITSAYHMPRSMETFKKMGTDAIAAPTDFKIVRKYNLWNFFPSSNNLEKSDLALHEYFGILFYKLYYY